MYIHMGRQWESIWLLKNSHDNTHTALIKYTTCQIISCKSHNNISEWMTIPVNGWPYQWMDDHTSEWMTIPVNGWPYQWMDDHTSEWMTIPVNGWPYQWMDEHTSEWMSIPVNGWAYQWMDEHTSEWIRHRRWRSRRQSYSLRLLCDEVSDLVK